MTVTRRLLVLAVLSVFMSSGCALNGLAFKQDERVSIEYPEAGDTVTLPFTLSWTATGVNESFAIFFDRAPMRPNQDLLALVPENDPCRADPACPDADWLADHNIFVTHTPTLAIEHLPDRRASSRARDRHDVTIVLLDEDGTRVGESAWTQQFDVERSE